MNTEQIMALSRAYVMAIERRYFDEILTAKEALQNAITELVQGRDALKAEVKTLRDAATELAHQIDIGNFVDDHGHSAKMLSASIDLKKLLGGSAE